MRSFVPLLFAFFGLLFFSMEDCLAQVCGCTDPLAINYNASATVNDGSCEYESIVIESTPVGMLDSLLDGTSTLFFWNNGYWTFNDHNDNCRRCCDYGNPLYQRNRQSGYGRNLPRQSLSVFRRHR